MILRHGNRYFVTPFLWYSPTMKLIGNYFASPELVAERVVAVESDEVYLVFNHDSDISMTSVKDKVEVGTRTVNGRIISIKNICGSHFKVKTKRHEYLYTIKKREFHEVAHGERVFFSPPYMVTRNNGLNMIYYKGILRLVTDNDAVAAGGVALIRTPEKILVLDGMLSYTATTVTIRDGPVRKFVELDGRPLVGHVFYPPTKLYPPFHEVDSFVTINGVVFNASPISYHLLKHSVLAKDDPVVTLSPSEWDDSLL